MWQRWSTIASTRSSAVILGKMAHWKNPTDYEFPDGSTPARWAWEFMRRNPDYRADYAEAAKKLAQCPGNWLHGHGHKGKPAIRMMEALELSRERGFAWGQRDEIADPAQDSVPPFLTVFPIAPNAEQVDLFFYRPMEHAPYVQKPEYATLTFDVRRPLPAQLKRAMELLNSRKKQVDPIKVPHKGSQQWPTYLRLLDADEAGVSTAEIIQAIEAYKCLSNEAADGYTASDRVSDHRKRARELLADPLSLIR